VDVRLLAATHRDLQRQVQEQKFREDLLYRINAVALVVPPLRERGEDVLLLARILLDRIAQEVGRPGLTLSPEAERAVAAHPWPGNVRQLRNSMERAALLAPGHTLGADDVLPPGPPAAAAGGAPLVSLREMERRHIEAVLRASEGVVPRAAEVLGLSRSALYDRMRKHGLAARRP
jgi:DNA-binding NtrC family response regulator